MTGGLEDLHPLWAGKSPPGLPVGALSPQSSCSPFLGDSAGRRSISRRVVSRRQVEESEQSRTDLSPTSQAGGGHPAPLVPGPWQRAEDLRGGPLAPAQPRLSGWQALFCHIEGRAARGVQVTLLLSQEGTGVDLVLLFCSVRALRSWPLCKLPRKVRKETRIQGVLTVYQAPGAWAQRRGAGLLGEEAQGEPRAVGGDAAPGTSPGPQFPLPNVRALAAKLLQSLPL